MQIESYPTEGNRLVWNGLVGSSSVFASWEYMRIKEEFEGSEARLFVLRSAESVLVYPFLLRPVHELPFARSDDWSNATDTTTPEYTGVIFGSGSQRCDLAVAAQFYPTFHQYCVENEIVAEFAHLHPWLACEHALDREEIVTDRPIVYVDLNLSEKDIWLNSFNRTCRKNVSKAQREGVEVDFSDDLEDIHEFYRVYIETMERNNAAEKYHFPFDYFQRYLELMPNSSVFAFARSQGRIIASTLFLFDHVNVYSYLGGMRQDYQHLRPTNALIHDVIRWAQKHNKKRLILGGGFEPDDGIFRFKSTFSPLTVNFRTYRKVHVPGAYSRLCEMRRMLDRSGFQDSQYFPAYRR